MKDASSSPVCNQPASACGTDTSRESQPYQCGGRKAKARLELPLFGGGLSFLAEVTLCALVLYSINIICRRSLDFPKSAA